MLSKNLRLYLRSENLVDWKREVSDFHQNQLAVNVKKTYNTLSQITYIFAYRSSSLPLSRRGLSRNLWWNTAKELSRIMLASEL